VKVQQHVCVNDCHRFPWLDSRQYRQHQYDHCPCCKERRFEIKETPSGSRLVPRKVFYDFGLDNIIRDRMFTDPTFCQHRSKGRQDYYYTSTEAERLHRAASRADLDTSVYELGADWAQMYTSKVHSTGLGLGLASYF
jgi:hypothetical protein